MSYKKYLVGFGLVLVLVVGVVLVSQLNVSTKIDDQLGATSLFFHCIDQDETNIDSNESLSYTQASYVSITGPLGRVTRYYDKKANGTLSEAYCSSPTARNVSYRNFNCNIAPYDGFTSRAYGNTAAWACKKACVPSCPSGVTCGTSDGCSGKCSGSCSGGKSCDSTLKRCVNTCTDTDGGINLTQSGTVTANDVAYTDSCDRRKVVENYCSISKIRQGRSYNCPIANGRAQACLQGVCAVFTLLPAPGGLSYDKDFAELSWTAVPNASGYSYSYFNTANQQMGNPTGLADTHFTLGGRAVSGYRFVISTLNFAGEKSYLPAIFYVP